MVTNGRRLGAFLLLFKSEAPPKLDLRLVEEVHQVGLGDECMGIEKRLRIRSTQLTPSINMAPLSHNYLPQIVAGSDKDVADWLAAPTTDAPRLQLLLQVRRGLRLCGLGWLCVPLCLIGAGVTD